MSQPTLGLESKMPLSCLSAQRDHVLEILEGLDEEALRRPVLPSGWTGLGLVRISSRSGHRAVLVPRHCRRRADHHRRTDRSARRRRGAAPERCWTAEGRVSSAPRRHSGAAHNLERSMGISTPIATASGQAASKEGNESWTAGVSVLASAPRHPSKSLPSHPDGYRLQPRAPITSVPYVTQLGRLPRGEHTDEPIAFSSGRSYYR